MKFLSSITFASFKSFLKKKSRVRAELYRNLKNEYTLEVIVKKEIVTLEEIKSLYKKELIDQEMETEEFKKVLAKFPNAKIIDIEEIERGDDNDG